jgi:hypothetical protein
MSEIDRDFIATIVRELQGITLDAAVAERIADVNASVVKTLDAVAGGSLFDTEPAHFDRMLSDLAEAGGAAGDD